MAIERILDISARMLAAARAGDWDAVARLESERRCVLEQVRLDGPAALPVLKTLLAHTEAVRSLAGQHREQLGEALGQHQQRHRALSAYLQASLD
ncbi:MAG TPA: flagellar protein FliT [Dyella sp.]|uniref:flagellar protein FliT n=1 Tax=Dyella sp. TaxID=1869338 RepID=UPI002D7889F0|nr:flagellar protein FliT [Dyella sp.]HET6554913.1 flagellar protein FliT [Dyella sp.]